MTKQMQPLLLALIVITLSGCGRQAPAPVISGFQGERAPSSQMYTGSARVQEEVYKPAGTQTLYHVVKKGDTLWDIAQKYDTTTGQVKALNNMQSSMLRVGRKLKVKHEADAAARDVAKASSAASSQRQSFTNRISSRTSSRGSAATSAPRPEPETKTAEVMQKSESVSQKLHRVRKGENLFRIGLKYNVSPLDIMAVNDIAKPEDLQAGSVITVPVVEETTTVTGTQAERSVNEELARKRGFIWPARGDVIQKFGRQADGVVNNGIKIKLEENTPVHAAESGKVIYADDGMKTYGNLILLRHNNGLITAYAHNSQSMVNKGESVKKGEVIALAGMSGNVNKPQLHFEVRRNARAIDPLNILPN